MIIFYFYRASRKEAFFYQKAALPPKTSQYLQTWMPRERMTARTVWKLSALFVTMISECLSITLTYPMTSENGYTLTYGCQPRATSLKSRSPKTGKGARFSFTGCSDMSGLHFLMCGRELSAKPAYFFVVRAERVKALTRHVRTS